MPFLFPALIALASDAIVLLFLGRQHPKHPIYDDEDKHSWVYRIRYLGYLALARVILLLLPLLFHSYTGTALRFPSLYQLLYWGTFVVVIFHMLSLSLVNPESLEALVPVDSSSADPMILHELRRIWWVLVLSLISDSCHLVLLMNVRSTAPNHHLLLMTGKRQPSVYFALRSARTGASFAPGSPDGEHQALMHAMAEFMDDIQLRLQRTKVVWAARLEDFSRRISTNHNERPRRSMPNPLAPLTPFRVLLQLFADEDVMENGKIDAVFDLDDGTSMTFFVPQLLSFLLHGALDKSQNLEEWILNKCYRNIYFAHRCYWFLRAWCLEVPAQAPAQSRQNSEGRLSANTNNSLVPFLDEPASPQPVIPCAPRSTRDRSSLQPRSPEKLLPEERVMIERLMLRVKECGESAAEALAFGPGPGPEMDHASNSSLDGSMENGHATNGHLDTDICTSPSELMLAAESGAIPIDPGTGFPSVKHLDCISARHRYGFLPLGDQIIQRRGLSPNETHSETEQFDKTPQFLDALIFLADGLFQVPPQDRKDELRKQLRTMECELLPSNAIYMPIGNVHHRVWRIIADESIPIGTKERVPCFVCLEVVDVMAKRPKPHAWSFLDRLPRRDQRATCYESAESVTQTPGRRVSSLEGIELSDFQETKTLDEWRHGRRDPLRRTSLFDKVAISVVDSVKGPLDKMKVLGTFHEHERSFSEELRGLVGGDVLVDRPSQEGSQLSERSEADVEDVSESFEQPIAWEGRLSRVSSSGSLASMGQWTSPDTVERGISRPQISNGNIRRRLSDALGDEDARSLPYGSDHEEDPNLGDPLSSPSKTKSGREGASSSKTKTRRPPVVFRESWQSKQERLRLKSAYGSNPGWRLLTVMVKANDDLRQEQLVCQLIYQMAAILAREKVPVWLCPYEIIALTDKGGIIEAIPDTISLDSLKRNDPNFRGLKYFFLSHFGEATEDFADAQANFVESLAAYSIACFLLQLKDRHNGNILLDNRGHLVHIDFGFFFLSSPGKNVGFESAPFKLTRDFVEVLGGPHSRLFGVYRELCVKTFLTLRKHCMEIILLVEMLKIGNEELNCFRGRPDEAIRQLRERFRLDLNDRACREYVNSLVDDSIENWRTDWYDRYQRYCVGVL